MGERRDSSVVGVRRRPGSRRRRAITLVAAGLLILVVALLCGAVLPSLASAAADDDIPGVPAPASPITGSLSHASDIRDVYAISVPEGKVIRVSLSADAGTDFDMRLYSPSSVDLVSGRVVAGAYGTRYPDTFKYVALETGTYYLDVYSYRGDGSYTATYSVEDPGKITGTVTDSSAVKLEGIEVTAYRDDGSGDWDYVDRTSTSVDGAYDLSGLPAGDYRVVFEDWSGSYLDEWYNGMPDRDHADVISVDAGQTYALDDAVLAAPSHITGTVTNSSAEKLKGIWVTAYRDDGAGGWDYVDDASTDANGDYDIDYLRAGTYRVEFRDWTGEYARECYDGDPDLDHADDVEVAVEATHGGVDAELARAGHIAGTVTGSGGPLKDKYVTAYRDYGSGEWEYVDVTSTATDGSYDIGGLGAGDYRVEFWDEGATYATEFYEDKASVQAADDVPVTLDNTTTGIDADLGKAGSITGTVTKTGGAALQGIWVTAYRDDGSGTWDELVDETSTSSTGTYEMDRLRADTYRIKFADETGPYVTQFFNGKSTVLLADNVVVAAEQTRENVNATLVLPAPTVTNFTPTSGAVGAAVTLTGTHFTGATKVSFHGTDQATLTVVSATQITTTVPAGATTGTISVTTPGGTGTSAASFTVTPPPPPPPEPTPEPTPSQAPLPAGSDETVTVSGFTVTFPQVSSAGTLTGTISVPPAGTAVPGCSSVAVTLKLETSATFSGEVVIQIPIAVLRANGYAGPVDKLRLMHQASSGAWEDVTWKLTATDIYGKVTSFSSFAVARDTAKPVVKALKAVSVKRGAKAKLRYKVSDAASKTALTTIKIYKGKKLKKTLKLGQCATNKNLAYSYKCKLAKGSYIWKLYATDLAGNAQAKVSSQKLLVK